MKHAISKITVNELTHDRLALINNLKTLLDFRSGYINIVGFTIDHVNNLMYTLCIVYRCNFNSMFVIFL